MKTIFSMILVVFCLSLSAQNHVFDSVTANYIGIGQTYSQAQLEIMGCAKVSDSIQVPYITNYNSVNLYSWGELQSFSRMNCFGYFGRASMLTQYFGDNNTSRGRRMANFSISSPAYGGLMWFGKNDTVNFVQYDWDTTSFFTSINRKDLGKSLFPWRNLYAQHVYTNGIHSTGNIHIANSVPTLYLGDGSVDIRPRLVFMQDGTEGAVIEQENDNGGRMFITNKVNTGFGNMSFKTNDIERLTILENGFIGIGLTNPGALIHSSAEGSGAWWNDAYSNTSGNKPNFILRRSAGTKSSPTKLLNGYDLGAISFYGSYGTGTAIFAAGAQARIIAQAEEDFIGTSNLGTRLALATTPTGGALTTRMTIKSTGFIGVGTTGPTSNFHIVAPNSGAESLLKCEVSDAAGSYFDVGNGTSVNGGFIPAFTGFNNTDGRSGFGLYGVHQDALFSSKLYPAIGFGGFNTSWGALTTTPIFGLTNSNFEEFCIWYDGRTTIGPHNQVSGTGAVGSIRPSTMLDVKSITGNTSDLLNLIDNSTSRFYVEKGGEIGIGTTAPTTTLDINSNTIRLRNARTVSTSTSEGNAGDISWDANYIYVCIAANQWKRSPLTTW